MPVGSREPGDLPGGEAGAFFREERMSSQEATFRESTVVYPLRGTPRGVGRDPIVGPRLPSRF